MNNKAFTLIELLIVISIISLLSTVVMYSISEAKIGAQDTHKKEETRQVNNALAIYKDKNKSAPRGLNANASASFGVAYNENTPEYQSAMQTLVDENALSEIPSSPNGVDYFYIVEEEGNGVFGTVLRSDKEINNNNGCTFSDDNYGCSGSAKTYVFEYNRDSLIQNSADCLEEEDCGGVEDNAAASSGPEWSGHLGNAIWNVANSNCNDLTQGGNSDWRLPIISEISSFFTENPSGFINPAAYVSSEIFFSDLGADSARYYRTIDGQIGYACAFERCGRDPSIQTFDYGCIRP